MANGRDLGPTLPPMSGRQVRLISAEEAVAMAFDEMPPSAQSAHVGAPVLMTAAHPVRQAACLGCGCTDSNACISGDFFPCHWIRVSYARRIGVCSECPEAIAEFDRACTLAVVRG